jgi:peptidoglycan/xylan/chitin deacetylase (PgdA/CDA1 family)
MMQNETRSTGDGFLGGGALLQRKCGCGGSCGSCGGSEEKVQRAAAGGVQAPQVAPPIVHDVVGSAGRPLDAPTRAYMEPRFGADFSRVRVHTGGEASRSSAAVGAEAYTVGQHIVFRDGFSPRSPEGKSLLAHELAHTVQQRGASSRPQGALPVGSESGAAETEAHSLAESAAAAKTPPTPAASGPSVARATRKFLLTFDDGPHAAALCKGTNRTEAVLNTLCDKSIKAAFFVQTRAEDAAHAKIRGSSPVGKQLITRMAADGHTVGIHTGGKADHEDHTAALAGGRLESELNDAKADVKTLTGKAPTLVRPPHGTHSKGVDAVYKKTGLTNVLWDIDGDQGKNQPLADLQTRVKKGIKAMIAGGWAGTTPMAPNIVVLYHDIQKNTSSNIGALIDLIKSETKAQTGGADTADFPSISCKKPKCPAKVKPVLKTPKAGAGKPAKEAPKPEKKDPPTPAPKDPATFPNSSLDPGPETPVASADRGETVDEDETMPIAATEDSGEAAQEEA